MTKISTSLGTSKTKKPKRCAEDGITASLRTDAALLGQNFAIGIVHMPGNSTSKRLNALADQVSYRLRKCRGEIHNNDANVLMFEACERELRRAAVLLDTGPISLPGEGIASFMMRTHCEKEAEGVQRSCGRTVTMTALLPCPFCGEKEIFLNEPTQKHRYGSINCPVCLVVMPGEVRDQNELIGCWNARHGVPAQQKPEPVAWQHRLRECGGWSGWTLIGKGFHDAIAADKAEGRREDYDLRELYADPRPDLPPLVDRAELIALLDDLASVNLSREACARQARRMADDLIARGLTFPSTEEKSP